MIPYTLNYTIEKLASTYSTGEQQIIRQLTGKSLDKREARQVWSKVQDHKWYVSERLGRDVGFRVAAVDFIENIYPSNISSGRSAGNKQQQSSQMPFMPL
jgi:hypothetical protein